LTNESPVLLGSEKQSAGSMAGAVAVSGDYNGSGEIFKKLLRFRLLLVVSFQSNLLQNIPGAVAVTHLDIGPGQIKFGGCLVGAGEEVEVVIITQVTVIDVQSCRRSGATFGDWFRRLFRFERWHIGLIIGGICIRLKILKRVFKAQFFIQ